MSEGNSHSQVATALSPPSRTGVRRPVSVRIVALYSHDSPQLSIETLSTAVSPSTFIQIFPMHWTRK